MVTVTVRVTVVGGAVVADPETVVVTVVTLPCALTVTVPGAGAGAVVVTVPYVVLIRTDVVSVVVVEVTGEAVVVTVVAGTPAGVAEPFPEEPITNPTMPKTTAPRIVPSSTGTTVLRSSSRWVRNSGSSGGSCSRGNKSSKPVIVHRAPSQLPTTGCVRVFGPIVPYPGARCRICAETCHAR